MIDEAELPQEAIGKIAEVLSQSEYQLPITNDAFYEACALVAARADISLIFPSTNENKNTLSLLQALADQSRFRFREVVLEDDWWQEDNGPLLGFLCEDNYPCALLPHKKGYEVIIPGQNKSMILNKKNAGLIAKNAGRGLFGFFKLPIKRYFRQDSREEELNFLEDIDFFLQGEGAVLSTENKEKLKLSALNLVRFKIRMEEHGNGSQLKRIIETRLKEVGLFNNQEIITDFLDLCERINIAVPPGLEACFREDLRVLAYN